MILEWTTSHVVDFPDDEINRLCDIIHQDGYNEASLRRAINIEVAGWCDDVYYNWESEQTDAVLEEVKRRASGIQLSMFDKEE